MEKIKQKEKSWYEKSRKFIYDLFNIDGAYHIDTDFIAAVGVISTTVATIYKPNMYLVASLGVHYTYLAATKRKTINKIAEKINGKTKKS